MRYMKNFYWKGYKDCLSQGQQGVSTSDQDHDYHDVANVATNYGTVKARNNNSYPHSNGYYSR